MTTDYSSGIDIVKIERIKNSIEKYNQRFIDRIFHPVEIEYCQKKPHPHQHFAARFAAKEAFVKALKTGFSNGIRWCDIYIKNEPSGEPRLHLAPAIESMMIKCGYNKSAVSLSHTDSDAIAVVILWS